LSAAVVSSGGMPLLCCCSSSIGPATVGHRQRGRGSSGCCFCCGYNPLFLPVTVAV
jgi:hypothetical protein